MHSKENDLKIYKEQPKHYYYIICFSPNSNNPLLHTEKWGRFDNAYRQAVTSIRGLGKSIAGLKRKGSSDPYAKKARLSGWTHRFVCLSSTEDVRVPTARFAREMLH